MRQAFWEKQEAKYLSLVGVSKNFKRLMDLNKYILAAEDHPENQINRRTNSNFVELPLCFLFLLLVGSRVKLVGMGLQGPFPVCFPNYNQGVQ